MGWPASAAKSATEGPPKSLVVHSLGGTRNGLSYRPGWGPVAPRKASSGSVRGPYSSALAPAKDAAPPDGPGTCQ
jgi:hypothetical protein